ncbi:hypothetical protein [Pendulispora rubella]
MKQLVHRPDGDSPTNPPLEHLEVLRRQNPSTRLFVHPDFSSL